MSPAALRYLVTAARDMLDRALQFDRAHAIYDVLQKHLGADVKFGRREAFVDDYLESLPHKVELAVLVCGVRRNTLFRDPDGEVCLLHEVGATPATDAAIDHVSNVLQEIPR